MKYVKVFVPTCVCGNKGKRRNDQSFWLKRLVFEPSTVRVQIQSDIFRRSLRYISRGRETWLKWKSYGKRRGEKQ